MMKNPMEHSSGDLGTKAAEESLKSTSAGKNYSSGSMETHMPNLEKATSYLKKMDCRIGKTSGGSMDKY